MNDTGYDDLTLYSDFIDAAIIKAMMASTATIPSTSGAMVTLLLLMERRSRENRS